LTRVTSFCALPVFRRLLVFLPVEARRVLFRADVERFLVEDLRALLRVRLADLRLPPRVLLFARLDDPERLRAAPPLLERPAERFVPDDFLAAMVHSSCFGGSQCSVRKNRAQGRRPLPARHPRYHQRLTRKGEEMQCEYAHLSG
jgi:hypothetical protein